MRPIGIDRKYAEVSDVEIKEYEQLALQSMKFLLQRNYKGNDFIGWLNYSETMDNDFYYGIESIANEIRDKATVLVVIGIGGSYLGAKSAIESLNNTFYNEKARKSGNLAIYFAGQSLGSHYIKELIDHIKDESIYVNVISKSGTTTEPAVVFRQIKSLMMQKYQGEELEKRIIVTTDAKKGALKSLADKENFRTFVIPDDIGGRFSVITPVGLLPIACSGINIRELMYGFIYAEKRFKSVEDVFQNEALLYAVLRHILYKRGKKIEILVNYEPRLTFIAEWWKQLFGESQGKELKGIYPSNLNFTTDLHSVGQYVQQGERILFETVLEILNDDNFIEMKLEESNEDGLNYLAGKSLADINATAMKATMIAHYDGGVPNILLQIEKWDEFHLGYLYAFFMYAVSFGGYMLDLNPFDQPGVEDYKKNMFALLGKDGYDELRKKLEAQ